MVEIHGLFGTARFGVDLRLETRSLIDGIVQLTESVADLLAMDEELEAIDQRRIRVLATCQV